MTVGVIDVKKDWTVGQDDASSVAKFQLLRLTSSDDPLIPLEEMSSIKVVKVGCYFLAFQNCVMQFDPVSELPFVEHIAESDQFDAQTCHALIYARDVMRTALC